MRQNYARTLHADYGYPKNLMRFEAPINIGSEVRFADIAIYHDATAARKHDQSKIGIVVETKAPDVATGQKQLHSYIFASSAEGGVWINDNDPPAYFHRVESPRRGLRDWPNLPRSGELWESVGSHTKSKLRPPHNLVETFKRCHNALYKVGIDSEDLAMDMVRIILAKYRDEQNEGETPEFRCTALELQSAEGRRRVSHRVHELFSQVRDDNKDVFEPHETITAGAREIATVVSELQEFRFLPEDDSDEIYDVVGAAYEVYVGTHLKGDRGQYFTHRLIVRLLVRLVDPRESDVILDPAMGSGGFLIASMRHVTQAVLKSKRSAKAKNTAVYNVRRHLFGVDSSIKLVKVAKTNMILASDGHSGLVRGNSLEFGKLPSEFLKLAGPGVPTVILTNPPFGATAEHRITPEKHPEIVSRFEVARIWRKDGDDQLSPTDVLATGGVPPEYLFVELCLKWLAPGGKLGIVVPRGILDNDRALPVRSLIFREARVLAVVNCHDDTFKPHTDAKTAILVLEKKTAASRERENYPIFMAISQAIGHNGVGEPIYREDAKGDLVLIDGEPVIDHDTDEIFDAWQNLRESRESASPYYFMLERTKITDGLTLNPVRYLPKYSDSHKRVLSLGERDGWRLEHLGEIANVFGGPRFKRPYADKGVTEGESIVRYFTGNAVTQTRGENIKFLDLNKAKPRQVKQLEQLRLSRGMILITRSGTVGRVVYATKYHDGAIGTEDVIRVWIDDEALRGYVYQFLLSELGQHQLRKNVYGAIVDHIEARDVKKVAIPLPADEGLLRGVGLPVIRAIELQEAAFDNMEGSSERLADLVGGYGDDAVDAAIVHVRSAELRENPDAIVTGEALEERLRELNS